MSQDENFFVSLKFFHVSQLLMSEDSPRGDAKRPRLSEDSDEVKQIFISNIPYDVSQVGLEGALKRMFGKYPSYKGIKKLVMNRGFAFVEYGDAADAAKAVEENQDKKMGPRTLRVQLSRPPARRTSQNDQPDQPVQCTLPDADCWFCLANPNFEKRMVFAVDETASVYASLAKGQLTPGHSVVCPVTHFGCFAQADEKTRNACEEMVSKLTRLFEKQGKSVLVYERWIPMNTHSANHMQVHVVPIANETNVDWEKLLKDKGRDIDIDFAEVDSHLQVVEKMKGILTRVSYLYIRVPGDNQVQYLGLGKMPFTFPREIVCAALGTPERIDWKSCAAEPSDEEQTLEVLKADLASIVSEDSEEETP